MTKARSHPGVRPRGLIRSTGAQNAGAILLLIARFRSNGIFRREPLRVRRSRTSPGSDRRTHESATTFKHGALKRAVTALQYDRSRDHFGLTVSLQRAAVRRSRTCARRVETEREPASSAMNATEVSLCPRPKHDTFGTSIAHHASSVTANAERTPSPRSVSCANRRFSEKHAFCLGPKGFKRVETLVR